MNSRAYLHYLLAFTVLFASSFAVFHSNEHLEVGTNGLPSFSSYYSHFEHPDHDGHAFSDARTKHKEYVSHGVHLDGEHVHLSEHAVELLCEACFVLSGMASALIGKYNPVFTRLCATYDTCSQQRVVRSHYSAYASRAPPQQV